MAGYKTVHFVRVMCSKIMFLINYFFNYDISFLIYFLALISSIDKKQFILKLIAFSPSLETSKNIHTNVVNKKKKRPNFLTLH